MPPRELMEVRESRAKERWRGCPGSPFLLRQAGRAEENPTYKRACACFVVRLWKLLCITRAN